MEIDVINCFLICVTTNTMFTTYKVCSKPHRIPKIYGNQIKYYHFSYL